MYYRIHTDNVFNPIGVWLFSVISHPKAIVIKEDSLLWQQVVAHKIELAKAVLDYEGETAATSYVKLTNKIRLLLVEAERTLSNLSDDEYHRRRDNAIAHGQWRLELAETGKTVEDIQRLEREIELQYVAQDNNDDKIKISASDVVTTNNVATKVESIPVHQTEYDFGSYLKELEDQDHKEFERILNSPLERKTIPEHGIFSWLFFEFSIFFHLIFIKVKYAQLKGKS
ncbi:hypothetical protein G7B40_030880 [Aetokthonos hydrillicola Thurmond2011]|jgi:hypothetical protein|uniref:Uncharacterized protein n=1 Tax=Aetokthonos hydrillicola Thurmond2011 TaxID=2712845 RepID=A0AAP5IEK1_9CYAN|nr:hypothetical protein [Aetokthonos hydrillicola]MBO3463390.1 hypothetical protein [Aetokthonos hydrillicola CCALA 1050]MBW4589675.1 hypothetical protein [Aetokthonos hydrillicola CCALA 1050]MDR9898929.1 hypothetical protein [Aetokthonos hydrillicola Thurmond2011]